MSVIIAGDSKIKKTFCFLACGRVPHCESKEKSSRIVRVFPSGGWRLQVLRVKKIICSLSVDLALWRSVITEDCFDLGRGVDSSDSESDSSFSEELAVKTAASSVA